MLQNRVDPFGNLIKTSARGSFMGNRGVIHDHEQKIVRPYKHKAWIICALQFKGRHRKVMMPDRWTELFFLDEATAFAAGHRPCAECRRENFNHFKSCWLKGNPEYNFDQKVSVKKIDEIIHAERINKDGTKVLHEEALKNLPFGIFISLNEEAYLFANDLLYKWSASGYEKGMALPSMKKIRVLTPKSVVNTLRAGYKPEATF